MGRKDERREPVPWILSGMLGGNDLPGYPVPTWSSMGGRAGAGEKGCELPRMPKVPPESLSAPEYLKEAWEWSGT